jgi:hypothetical protein
MSTTWVVRLGAVLTVLGVGLGSAREPVQDQPPWRGRNLQVFPQDIPRPELIQRMREFSFALDVRCQYCHAGGDGLSFDGVVFESDEKPAKQTARAMLRMVAALNESILPSIGNRQNPPVKMTCAICHRGLPRPKTLETELTGLIDRDGIEAAAKRYRDLRENGLLLGLFRFDEWEMNEVARVLGEAGKVEAAVAMLELNAEYFPQSVDIDLQLADLYLRQGDRARAVARLTAALVKAPDNTRIKQRLDQIKGG